MSEHKLSPRPGSTASTWRAARRTHAIRRASTLRAWANWRPEISTESLLLGLSLYFTLACNAPFWRALLAGRGTEEGTLVYVLAVGIALTALNFGLLAPLLNRWTTKPLLGVLILVAAIASYYARQFGVYFDPDMLRNVVRTDIAEARELLTPGMFAYLLALALPPLFVLQRVQLRRRRTARALIVRATSMALALVVALAALGSVFKDFSGEMRQHKEIRYLITPTAAAWSLGRVMTRDVAAANTPRRPIGTDAHLGASWQTAHKPLLFVITIGETARAANWGLNQPAAARAAHDTTPKLARRDVINFPDVSSCGTNTEVSLPCMFSVQGRRHYDEDAIHASESLLNVLQHAGLRVVWNDNQSGCKGVCTGLETIRPDPAAFPALCPDNRCLDEALVDSSRSLLRDAQGNLVLVLHQLGNHGPSYFRRYPEAFRRFTPTCDDDDLSQCNREQIVNSYDNALLYTDHVLARTIDLLKDVEDKYDSALVYVSDHGESLGENGLYLHGLPYSIAPSEQTRVPMVMWFSPGFAARNRLDLACLDKEAQQPTSHDTLFHTVLGLLDVTTSIHEPALDLGAACRR